MRSVLFKQRFFVCACTVFIVLGLYLRIRGIFDVNLWEDEIYSTTHAVQGFRTFLVNVIRNDIHPHLYYFQLYLWAKVSHSDEWFFLNSILWGTAAIVTAWFVGRRLYGDIAGLTAAATLSLIPMAISLSQIVRMYSMLIFFVLVTFFIVEQTMTRGEWALRGKNRLAFVGLNLALIYSHLLGVLPVFFLGLYGLHGLLSRGADRKNIHAWGSAYAFLTFLSLPVIALALGHDADSSMYSSIRSGEMVLRSIASLSVGGSSFRSDATFAAGLLICLGFVAVGLWLRELRRLTVWLLLAPALIAFVIGSLIYPIFKPPIFASLFLPISALIIGRFAGDIGRKLSSGFSQVKVEILVLGGLSVLFLFSLLTLQHESKATDFRAASELIANNLRAGDVIYAPDRSMFWGVNWYLVGPGWGSPLAIAESPNDRWQAIYTILGSDVVEALDLNPKSQLLEYHGATIVTGYDELSRVIQGRTIWLVTYWNRRPVEISEAVFTPTLSEKFGGMLIQRFERIARGSE